jgi:hypothetical protein
VAKPAPQEGDVVMERRNNSKKTDRRGGDRRAADVPVAVERRKLERREKVNRRRQIDPTTCERDYSDAEIEFMHAMDAYKRKSGRMFPTCSEILEVIRDLGYVKQAIVPPTPVAAGEATAAAALETIESATIAAEKSP